MGTPAASQARSIALAPATISLAVKVLILSFLMDGSYCWRSIGHRSATLEARRSNAGMAAPKFWKRITAFIDVLADCRLAGTVASA
jgi:hypothetical protein